MLDTTQRPSAASGDLLGHQPKCDQCGKPFEPRSKSGGKSQRFCSPEYRPGRHFLRGADIKLRHGKGRKALSDGARLASKRNITNRFELVRCEACGRRVKRKSRQQLYCSDRCREWSKGPIQRGEGQVLWYEQLTPAAKRISRRITRTQKTLMAWCKGKYFVPILTRYATHDIHGTMQ